MSIIASILAVTVTVAGCTHAGIIVVPTAPSNNSTTEVPESIAVGETQAATSPPETSAPSETVPTESTSPPVTESVEPSVPLETSVPPETLPTYTTPSETIPPETVPIEPTAPTEAPPVESTAPPETTESTGSSLRHDPYDVAAYSISDAEQVLLNQIHAMRTKKQLPALVTDKELCALAYIRAYEAIEQFSHVRPDGNSYTAVFSEYGYFYTASGENILKSEDWYPATYILEDWLYAKVTADNLTNPEFTQLGVGIYEKDGNIYVACLLTAK